jgi:hypothetical protein
VEPFCSLSITFWFLRNAHQVKVEPPFAASAAFAWFLLHKKNKLF